MKLSRVSWLVALLACVLLVQGAYSIDVGFSVESGGESASLESSYDVDTGVSVSEESTASPGQATIENSRSVTGTGDITASQTYSGSGGYSGTSFFKTGAGSLASSASLNPTSLSALQIVSASGVSNAEMGVINEGTAHVDCNLISGSMTAAQSISTGSAQASCNAQLNGAMGSIAAGVFSPREGSAELFSGYSLSPGISASEEISASSDLISIVNTRSISGTGDFDAFQSYFGSNGCSGSSNLYANDVSGKLESAATLTPSELRVSQLTSLSGDSVDVSLSLDHEGDSIYMSSGIGKGTITTSQDVWTGSVHGSQNTLVLSESARIQLIAIINSLQKLINDLQEFSGNLPAASAVRTLKRFSRPGKRPFHSMA